MVYIATGQGLDFEVHESKSYLVRGSHAVEYVRGHVAQSIDTIAAGRPIRIVGAAVGVGVGIVVVVVVGQSTFSPFLSSCLLGVGLSKVLEPALIRDLSLLTVVARPLAVALFSPLTQRDIPQGLHPKWLQNCVGGRECSHLLLAT